MNDKYTLLTDEQEARKLSTPFNFTQIYQPSSKGLIAFALDKRRQHRIIQMTPRRRHTSQQNVPYSLFDLLVNAMRATVTIPRPLLGVRKYDCCELCVNELINYYQCKILQRLVCIRC